MSAVRLVGISALAFGALVALLFLPAGRLDWWPGWAFIGLIAAGTLIAGPLVWRRDPELARRRMKIGEGTAGWDRLILVFVKLFSVAAIALGALDAGRLGWSSMSIWWWPVGAALYAAGYAILTASMLANTHFEFTVRIQSDRDHRVIDSGPYRVVRHPGYAGSAVLMAGLPLLLRSWWVFVPVLGLVAVLVVRILLEERLLRRELPGYEEYRATVRHRLLPGIW